MFSGHKCSRDSLSNVWESSFVQICYGQATAGMIIYASNKCLSFLLMLYGVLLLKQKSKADKSWVDYFMHFIPYKWACQSSLYTWIWTLTIPNPQLFEK